MLCACLCARRPTFVSVKLQQQTLKSWIEAKCYLKINSNNALINHLFELATLSTISSKVSSNNNICVKCIMVPAFWVLLQYAETTTGIAIALIISACSYFLCNILWRLLHFT